MEGAKRGRKKKPAYYPDWLKPFLGRDIRDVPFAIFDTETTGLGGKARVHQIGVTTLLNGVTEEDDCINFYINIFDDHSPEDDELVDMYDYAPLHDQPHFNTEVDRFEGYIKDKLIVAHNQGFDRRKIHQEYELIGRPIPPSLRTKYFDTRKIADLVIKEELYGDRKLDTVAEILGIDMPNEEDRHQALPDAILTGQCMATLLKMHYEDRPTTIEQLITDLKMKFDPEKDG